MLSFIFLIRAEVQRPHPEDSSQGRDLRWQGGPRGRGGGPLNSELARTC